MNSFCPHASSLLTFKKKFYMILLPFSPWMNSKKNNNNIFHTKKYRYVCISDTSRVSHFRPYVLLTERIKSGLFWGNTSAYIPQGWRAQLVWRDMGLVHMFRGFCGCIHASPSVHAHTTFIPFMRVHCVAAYTKHHQTSLFLFSLFLSLYIYRLLFTRLDHRIQSHQKGF